MLIINMLGKVNISYDGERIDDRLSNKLVALICLMVLNMNRDVSKDKLSAFLWPDSDEESAKYNLRYNLWMTKRLIPEDDCGRQLIVSEKDYCRINKEYNFKCDKLLLDEFHTGRQTSVDQLLVLKSLFKGDFLEGLYLKNCTEFNEMILFERVICQSRQVEILKELIDIYEAQGQYAEELEILHEVIAIEPYNEDFAYRIIELLMKQGNRVAAINYFKKFEASLRRNLNITPNSDLKHLYGTLLEPQVGARPEPREKARQGRKKLRLKARNMGSVEFFWVADLINELMKAADKKYMLELDKKYLFDLGFIQNELLLDYERHVSAEHEGIGFVPSVRIINAFSKFLEHACDIYDIEIEVSNVDDMDPLSANVLKLIQSSGINGLQIKSTISP